MSYSPEMRGRALFEHAMEVDPKEVRAALAQLIQRQSADLPRQNRSPKDIENDLLALYSDTLHSGPQKGEELDRWNQGQLDFARRLARIAANHAARQNQKLRWKHRSVGLLRRLALLVMVVAINLPLFF